MPADIGQSREHDIEGNRAKPHKGCNEKDDFASSRPVILDNLCAHR